MFVVKRDGRQEVVKFDKITARIEKLCYGFNPELVDPIDVAKKVIEGLFDGVTTSELDNLAAETAAFLRMPMTSLPDNAGLRPMLLSCSLSHDPPESIYPTAPRPCSQHPRLSVRA